MAVYQRGEVGDGTRPGARLRRVLSRLAKRPLLMITGWIAAAVLAVLVGLLAVSLIGAGLTSDSAPTMTGDEVARALAAEPGTPGVPPVSAGPGTPPGSAGPETSPASAAPPASTGVGASPSTPGGEVRLFSTRAGTVLGRCVDGRPEVVSMSPAQGYSVHDRDTGPQDDDADGEFRRGGNDDDTVEFEIVCTGGEPNLTIDD